MSTDPSTPENDANLSALGRELLDTGGSKPSGPWMPPTAEELHKLLPEYEIVKMLGRGGMGAVYMGKQISLDRPVAIKILSNALEEADASFAERFKNEAKAMGKLTHPGIVAVHAFGETEGGLLYIVMEFVEGTDVSRMIAKEGRLHTDHAMAITAHVCDALGYAHERGIIHRDIKPANIMVRYDGAVKVADFGLAKMTHSNSTGLTQSGMAMGTLHYMAPETLMLGSAVDHRADIYAVGVMLYQMLAGKLPQGMFELPSMLVPGLDPRYDAIIAKALREDREVRYQSIRDMRADLDSILTQPVVKVEDKPGEAPVEAAQNVKDSGPRDALPRIPTAEFAQATPPSKNWLPLALAGCVVIGIGAYALFGRSRSLDQDTVAEVLSASPGATTRSPNEAPGKAASNPTTAKTPPQSPQPPEKTPAKPGTAKTPGQAPTSPPPATPQTTPKIDPFPGFPDPGDPSWIKRMVEDRISTQPGGSPLSRSIRFLVDQSRSPAKPAPADVDTELLTKLRALHESLDDSFLSKLIYREIPMRPFPASEDGAVDNFTVAACRAAGRDVTSALELNPSPAAAAEISEYLKTTTWRPAARSPKPISPETTTHPDGRPRYTWTGRRVEVCATRNSWSDEFMGRFIDTLDAIHEMIEWLYGCPVASGMQPGDRVRFEDDPNRKSPAVSTIDADGVSYWPPRRLPTMISNFEKSAQLYESFVASSIGALSRRVDSKISLRDNGPFPDALSPPYRGLRIAVAALIYDRVGIHYHTQEATTRWLETEKTFQAYQARSTEDWLAFCRSGERSSMSKGYDSPLAIDVVEALIYRLTQQYGEEFLRRFLMTELQSVADSENDAMAVENFYIAASCAAGEDLWPLLVEQLRWPVSPEARTRVNRRVGASQSQSSAEGRALVFDYQKSRHQQLKALTGKYQQALKQAEEDAIQSGKLSDVEAVMAATNRAAAFAAEIGKLPKTLTITPLTPLPAVQEDAPESLKRLRSIFDGELLRIESTLKLDYEQSLEELTRTSRARP